MKKIKGSLILFLFFFSFPLWAFDPVVAPLEVKALPTFTPPTIRVHTFSNGLKLYFLQNRELPIFEMSAQIGMGDIHEPENKLGITHLVMAGLQTGGTQSLSGDAVDRQLEQVAAALSSNADSEFSKLEIRSMSKDIPLVVDIFFDLLMHPQFEAHKLEITKQHLLDEISRRNEDSMDIARREFSQSLYGDNSVWARLFTQKTVESISRDDVINAYRQYGAPDNVRLAISGNIDFETLIFLIERKTASWKNQPVLLPPITEMQKVWTPSLQYVQKASNQSSIVIGHLGEKRFNPDKYALSLANHILGGTTFGSRLGNRIRTDLGLAYSISSAFGLSTDYGLFEITAGTKSQSTAEVVMEAKKILAGLMNDEPPTESELADAKKTVLNQLIFEYQDPFKIVEARRYYDFYGYPPDYLTLYQQEISKVTLDQVKEAFKKYFFPDRLVVMVVGDSTAMGDLSGLGKVERRPLDDH